MDPSEVTKKDEETPLNPTVSLPMLRAIYQFCPDAIMIVNGEGRIITVNNRCHKLLGYEPAELIGQLVDRLVPPKYGDHALHRADFHRNPRVRAMSKRPILQALHKSGKTIAVDISLSPLPTIQGQEGLVEASLRDATPNIDLNQNLLLRSVAMDAAANGIVITDLTGTIRWVNPAVTTITGYAFDELIGQHSRLLKSGYHQDEFYRDLWETIMAGETWFGDIVNRRKDGTIYYEEQHIAPVRDDTGELTHFIAIKQDVTARKQAEMELQRANSELKRQLTQIEALQEQLRQQAIKDPLTNLFNRRYLNESLSREMARVKRDGTELCVIAIDVDHFKRINDTVGHAAGDLVLSTLGMTITKGVRECDIACRSGGDEFLIVMPGITLDLAGKRGEELSTKFNQAQLDAQRPIPLCTLSVGVTKIRPDESQDALLHRADRILYESKEQGRNCVHARP